MPEDFIDKVMHFISRDDDSGSDKDVLLKQLAKEVSQNKYAKFYRMRQGEADISLGQFFYGVYKTIYPMYVFMNDPSREAKIRQITLEAFLDKQVMELIKKLSPEAIAERKKAVGPEISKQLKEDLAVLSAGFDNPKIVAADKCYDLIASMKQFVFFNYLSLLRKFDPDLRDGDFQYQPKFAPVDASILAPEISTFLSVLPPNGADDNWKAVFEILKYCKGGTDVIPFGNWNNLLLSLKDVTHSKMLLLINKLATGNPILDVRQITHNENLSALWLEQKTIEVSEVIASITNSQKSAQISSLEQAVFGAPQSSRLNYYNLERGQALVNKGLLSYIYAPALNHLLIFVKDYISKEIQELCDILLVRGQWTKGNASRQMSESFHNVLEIAGEIVNLDESLSDDGTDGPRLKSALLRVDRDKSQARYINSIIESINDEALEIINKVVPSLIVVGKHFKMLMDDVDKKPFELMMNWKELSSFSKQPMSQRIGAAYKKVNYFVQLMLMETQETEE